MSKQHRTKLIKSLEQQLEVATDPRIKADISRQLTKLLSKPARKGSSRKPKATPSNKKTSALVAKWADQLSHLPEEKRIEFSVVLEVEKRYKSRGIEIYPPTPQNRVLLHGVIAEVVGELSPEEQAIYNEGSPEVA